MERLKIAMEDLDEAISVLEEKVGIDRVQRQDTHRKAMEALKTSKAREAQILSISQKVAARLDSAIEHVEHILKH